MTSSKGEYVPLLYQSLVDHFANSKAELHEELQKPKVLAGALEFYSDLVNLNAVLSIVDLLNHDNTDITIDIDLTNEDFLNDNDDSTRVLVDTLVDNNVLELLLQNLHRLNNSDPNENVIWAQVGPRAEECSRMDHFAPTSTCGLVLELSLNILMVERLKHK
ncbi:hypothetical protein JHK84_035505 [Glycine max]|nr:hypothetical protein JHK84_035505 [Glycine max]